MKCNLKISDDKIIHIKEKQLSANDQVLENIHSSRTLI